MHGVLREWPQGSNAEHTHVTVGFIGINCRVKLNLNLRRPARLRSAPSGARALSELNDSPVCLLVTCKQVLNRFGCGSTVKGRESITALPKWHSMRAQSSNSATHGCVRPTPTRPENSRTKWRNGRWMCAIQKTSAGCARPFAGAWVVVVTATTTTTRSLLCSMR